MLFIQDLIKFIQHHSLIYSKFLKEKMILKLCFNTNQKHLVLFKFVNMTKLINSVTTIDIIINLYNFFSDRYYQ